MGTGGIPRSTGSTLRDQCLALRRSTEPNITVRKRPLASSCIRACNEKDVTLSRGGSRPFARSASATYDAMRELSGNRTHGSSFSSSSVILRRRTHRLREPATTRNSSLHRTSKFTSLSTRGLRTRPIIKSTLRSRSSRNLLLCRLGVDHVYDNSRVLTRQPIDNGGYKCGRHRFWASDSHLSNCGISQELDVSYSLLQLIEHHMPTFEQCACVDRGLDTPRAAIEKTDPKRTLKAGNRFRDRLLGHAEMCGSLGHAAPFHDSGKDLEIAQLQPPTDAVLPVERRAGHRRYL